MESSSQEFGDGDAILENANGVSNDEDDRDSISTVDDWIQHSGSANTQLNDVNVSTDSEKDGDSISTMDDEDFCDTFVLDNGTGGNISASGNSNKIIADLMEDVPEENNGVLDLSVVKENIPEEISVVLDLSIIPEDNDVILDLSTGGNFSVLLHMYTF